MSTPISLTLYRGEKSQWWDPPEYRLMSGMTVYRPWKPDEVWMKLTEGIKAQRGNNVIEKAAAYAQYLRSTGCPFALATARTKGGSFDFDYNYVITIPDAYLYYWGGTTDAPDIGEPIPTDEQCKVKKDFIVKFWVDGSAIFGFGHKTGTEEITLFHDLPIGFIVSCTKRNIKRSDGKLEVLTPGAILKKGETIVDVERQITSLHIKKRAELLIDERIKYSKYFRPITHW